jgi:hypothetical protein
VSDTYERVDVGPVPAIRCLLCGRISELSGDVEHRYCGRCHLFHDSVAEGRRLHAAGATHDCGEWRTWRGRCAICEAAVGPPTEAEDDLLAAMLGELAEREAPLTVVLRPVSALHLAGLLQLALRHPGTSTSEAHHRIAVTFIEHVRAYFAGAPAVLEVLRRGDDPAYDA